MYHNHLIASPTKNTLVSVDVGSNTNASYGDNGTILYQAKYPLYLDGIRVGDTESLVIVAKNILISYRTESLM